MTQYFVARGQIEKTSHVGVVKRNGGQKKFSHRNGIPHNAQSHMIYNWVLSLVKVNNNI